MANFTKETSLYEILIRVHADGGWAAQYQTLTEYKEDGVLVEGATRIDAGIPLDREDSAAFGIVQQLLGEAASKNLAEHTKLLAKSSRDDALIQTLLEQIAALQPKVEAE
jgi:hypothetical protein